MWRRELRPSRPDCQPEIKVLAQTDLIEMYGRHANTVQLASAHCAYLNIPPGHSLSSAERASHSSGTRQSDVQRQRPREFGPGSTMRWF